MQGKTTKLLLGIKFYWKNTLYGRNWGAVVDIPFLHFELCYYQAIEYAIKHKISKVEAGAQGNHKIQRGYLASPIYSDTLFKINHFLML